MHTTRYLSLFPSDSSQELPDNHVFLPKLICTDLVKWSKEWSLCHELGCVTTRCILPFLTLTGGRSERFSIWANSQPIFTCFVVTPNEFSFGVKERVVVELNLCHLGMGCWRSEADLCSLEYHTNKNMRQIFEFWPRGAKLDTFLEFLQVCEILMADHSDINLPVNLIGLLSHEAVNFSRQTCTDFNDKPKSPQRYNLRSRKIASSSP